MIAIYVSQLIAPNAWLCMVSVTKTWLEQEVLNAVNCDDLEFALLRNILFVQSFRLFLQELRTFELVFDAEVVDVEKSLGQDDQVAL